MSESTPSSRTLDEDTVDAGTGRAPAPDVGGTIGRYVVLGRIGHGGMGVVYAAYDPELDRKVALKLLHGEGGADAHRRLTREAQAMARLSHPNVAGVHDVGEHEGRVYVAMEFIEGATLRVWIKRERPGWRRVLQVYVDAARGLAHAHARGLVHRDFKPDNVMLGDDGRVRVLDFGLARGPRDPALPIASGDAPADHVSGRESDDVTLENSAAGTPAYMAPEQHLGLPADARSDEFSWCVALWEGVYGERPFHAHTLAALALAVTDGRIRSPSAVRGVPGWLRAVLERGLASEPGHRYPDVEALLAAIERGRRRPRRLLFGASAVLAGASVLGLVALDQVERADEVATCEALAARAGAVWSAEAREQARRAFLATGSSYAAEAFERTVPWLDGWSQAFAHAQRESCLTRGQELAASDACFSEQLARFDSLVIGLLEIEAEQLPQAPGAAAMLPRVESCVDAVQARRRLELPGDANVRTRVDELRRRLAWTRTLDSLGRYEDGLEAARATLDDATELAWDPVRAESLLELAALEQRVAAYDDAVMHAREAFVVAGRAGHDEVAAEAASQLVFLVGERLSRFPEGEAWGEMAQILLIRSGDDQGLRMADLFANLGSLHHRSGALEQALVDQERGHQLRVSVFGEQHPLVAYSLSNLGNVHYARGELTQARAVLERALAIQRQVLGREHPDLAASLNNLGSIVKAGGDLAAARGYFEQAVAASERAFGREHPLVAMALGNLANCEREVGELEAALTHYERALAIREQILGPTDPALAYPLTGIGRVHVARAHYDAAVPVLERAASLREAEGVPPGARAETQFALARALWATDGERARAQMLVDAARAAFVDAARTQETAEIDAWLASRPP